MNQQPPWHNLTLDVVVETLGSNLKSGLSNQEAEIRQKKFGKNLLPEEKPPSGIFIVFRQLKNPMVFILLAAGILTVIFQYFVDAIIIFAVIFLNVFLGVVQEKKAASIFSRLKKTIKNQATILREGNLAVITAEDLVPGDIIILNPGDKVPADARIIYSHNLKTNEMILTGEWLPSLKTEKVLPEKTSLGDRNNLVYMETVAEEGKAEAIVLATGLNTKIGKIIQTLGQIKERKTSLQKKLSFFTKILASIIFVIAFLVFIEGIITGKNFIDIFTVSIAMTVAAVPESLPATLTVILAIAMQRILKKRGLIKKILATEILGSTKIICVDKTKTLTEGKMEVAAILPASEVARTKKGNNILVLKIAALAGAAFIENPAQAMEKWIVRGQPTEKAVLLAAISAGIDFKKVEKEMAKNKPVPFDTKRKYSANIYETKNKEFFVCILGAPERILEASKYFRIEEKESALKPADIQKIKSAFEGVAKKGLRVVGVAYRKIGKGEDLNNFFRELVFVGLISLKDPLRKDAKRAIEICQKAGMKPIIVTGDHKLTAIAVARELGLEIREENVLEGKDLELMSDDQLIKESEKIQIYARVEPLHKMRIINAFQEKGFITAMTGDGVNDAPALKKADIGVALGSGTEVAKESSDLILLNDNFSVIISAIEEGRRVTDNIRKVITYLLIGGFTEVILVGLSVIFRLPLPVLASQILWKNMLESTPPSIALAFEEKETDIMRRPPENPKLPLLTSEMNVLIFIIGLLTNLILFGIFIWFLKIGLPLDLIRSAMFLGLCIDSFLFVFSCKNLRKNIWHYNPFGNRYLNFSILVGGGLVLLAIYLPFFQKILQTTALGAFEWTVILIFGVLNLILIELAKWIFIKYKKTN